MRAQYARFLRDLDAVDHLLANLFRLMPENPVIQLKDTLTSHSPNQKLSSVMSMFSRDPMLPVAGKKTVMDTEYMFINLILDVELLSSWSNMLSDTCYQLFLDFSGDNFSLELQHLACTVYHRTLQDLPAIVRQWWNAQDKRVAGIVDKYGHLLQT